MKFIPNKFHLKKNGRYLILLLNVCRWDNYGSKTELPNGQGCAHMHRKNDSYRKRVMDINSESTQKQKILIVDDSEMNRSILADMLDNEYEILEAEDGASAISMLQKHVLDISLVLLDVVMPQVDGFEVLSVMNQKHWIEDIPVIMISAESGSSQVKRAYDLGVTDFIARPFDILIVRRRVVNTILLYTKQKNLSGCWPIRSMRKNATAI